MYRKVLFAYPLQREQRRRLMVSGQILKNTIERFGEITHVRPAVFDTNGKPLAVMDETEGLHESSLSAFSASEEREKTAGSWLLRKIYDDQEPIYIAAVRREAGKAEMALELIAFQLEGLNAASKERFDTDNFMKNLLLDNLLMIDIYNRARKLHITINAKRAVFIVEAIGQENSAHEQMRMLFEQRPQDFITAVDENNVVLVRELDQDSKDPYGEMKACAEEMETALTEAGIHTRVAYGTPISEIREVSKSYKEARLALDVGQIFYEEQSVIAYNSLGIGRLIYQLPLNLCHMFISEVFCGKSPEEFDKETLATIYKFFENSLNVSETSRQLFIHRNTLVYRLDKLQRATGLDLRVFDDAITFKIALMVVKYMDYMEKLDN